MRALVLLGPGNARVLEVEDPDPGAGEVVVDIERAGICGTDAEFFSGQMPYLEQGHAAYPLRIGHEWSGTVTALGEGVPTRWLGRRVTGDTMIGCGSCGLCARGRRHLCARREEIGIRGGRPGALAERLRVPVTALQELPASVVPTAGALVEPGGNALRAVQATALAAGDRLLVLGAGTIGLLATLFAAARGIAVSVAGREGEGLDLAERFGAVTSGSSGALAASGRHRFDAVLDATNSSAAPALALRLVEPGGRIALIGLGGGPSFIDTREATLADVTLVGILSASPALAETIVLYGAGMVVPDPVVGEVVALEQVAARLRRGPAPGVPPKVHVDPRL